MINFDTWLKMVEDVYGTKIVDWMIPFAEELFNDYWEPGPAAAELTIVWSDHNND